MRLLHLLGIDQFLLNDQFTVDMVQNGKSLVLLGKFIKFFYINFLNFRTKSN